MNSFCKQGASGRLKSVEHSKFNSSKEGGSALQFHAFWETDKTFKGAFGFFSGPSGRRDKERGNAVGCGVLMIIQLTSAGEFRLKTKEETVIEIVITWVIRKKCFDFF